MKRRPVHSLAGALAAGALIAAFAVMWIAALMQGGGESACLQAGRW